MRPSLRLTGLHLVIFSALLLLGRFCHADSTVTIAFGETLAPYVIEETESGLELDVIRAALKEEGLTLKAVFFPQKRLPLLLGHRQVDGVSLMTDKTAPSAALSDAYVTYEDYAITVASKGITLETISELRKYRVAGFPLASQLFGPEFQAMVKENPAYSEPSSQIDQNRLLYRDVIDVVVGDKRIFHYYDTVLIQQKLERPVEVTLHPLFARQSYRVAFRDKRLRNRFNHGLAAIMRKGIYQQISQKYQ